MKISSYALLFNETIDLESYGLGVIKQPTLGDLVKYDLHLGDFVSPYYIERIKRKDIGEFPLTHLGLLDLQLQKENKPSVMAKLLISLSILYDIEISNIGMDNMDGQLLILIPNKDYDKDKKITKDNIKYYILDDSNYSTFSDLVLKLCKVTITKEMDDSDIDEMDASEEVKELFRQGRAEQRARQQQNKDNVEFPDMCNELIHMLSPIDYYKILDWSIWQIKNSHTIMSVKNVQESYINSGSVQWKADNLPNWKEQTIINKE